MLTDDELNAINAIAGNPLMPGGDIVCAGVWNGGDVIEIRQAQVSTGQPARNLLIIDSFEGLADPLPEDSDCGNPMQAGECRAHGIGEMLRNFDLHGVTMPYEVYKFWINDEAMQLIPERPVAMIWLDLDHYEPTSAALRHFWPMLQPGGWVLTHDYGFERCPGVKRACDQIGEDWIHLAGGIFGKKKEA